MTAQHTAAHSTGAHAITPEPKCQTCQDLGYVGEGYDRERVAVGSA